MPELNTGRNTSWTILRTPAMLRRNQMTMKMTDLEPGRKKRIRIPPQVSVENNIVLFLYIGVLV